MVKVEVSQQRAQLDDRTSAEGGFPQTECVVCMVEEVTTLLAPCGHVCMCSACAHTVLAASDGERRCPLCRVAVQSSYRAYLPLSDAARDAARRRKAEEDMRAEPMPLDVGDLRFALTDPPHRKRHERHDWERRVAPLLRAELQLAGHPTSGYLPVLASRVIDLGLANKRLFAKLSALELLTDAQPLKSSIEAALQQPREDSV